MPPEHIRAKGAIAIALGVVAFSSSSLAEEGAPGLPPPPPTQTGFSSSTGPDSSLPNAEATAPASNPPTAPRLRAVVLQVAIVGVDPIVGQHVSDQMRLTAGEMGYDLVSSDETFSAARQIGMQYPPTPSDLWRITYAARAQRGLFGTVGAEEGRYVISIVAASLDGGGPFFARGTSGAEDLRAVTAQLVRQALPPVDRWNASEWRRLTEAPVETSQPAAIESESGSKWQDHPLPISTLNSPIGRRFSVALQTESAFGTTHDSFYNHLLGARWDFRILREIVIGAYVGYANLEGKIARNNNLLAYGQLEERIYVSQRIKLSVPLRIGFGYLPYNGPVVRISAGLNLPLSDRIEIGADLLAPMFWILQNRTAVSLDLAAEVILRI